MPMAPMPAAAAAAAAPAAAPAAAAAPAPAAAPAAGVGREGAGEVEREERGPQLTLAVRRRHRQPSMPSVLLPNSLLALA